MSIYDGEGMPKYSAISFDLVESEEFRNCSPHAHLVFLRLTTWRGSGIAKIFPYKIKSLVALLKISEEILLEALGDLEANGLIARDHVVLWLKHGLMDDPFVSLTSSKTRLAVLRYLRTLPSDSPVVHRFADHHGLTGELNLTEPAQQGVSIPLLNTGGSTYPLLSLPGSHSDSRSGLWITCGQLAGSANNDGHLDAVENWVVDAVTRRAVESLGTRKASRKKNAPIYSSSSSKDFKRGGGAGGGEESKPKDTYAVPEWPVEWGSPGCLVAFYNAHLPEGWEKVRAFNETRRKREKEFVKKYNFAFWEKVILEEIPASMFLKGRAWPKNGGYPFPSRNLDWLLQRHRLSGIENCVKVWEGYYRLMYVEPPKPVKSEQINETWKGVQEEALKQNAPNPHIAW